MIPTYVLVTDNFLKFEIFPDAPSCQLCELVRGESAYLCAQTRIQTYWDQNKKHFNYWSYVHAEQQWDSEKYGLQRQPAWVLILDPPLTTEDPEQDN